MLEEPELSNQDEEKPSLEVLIQRMTDLLVVLETIAKDLKELVSALKSSVRPLPAPPTPVPPTPRKLQKIEDIRMMFPKELEDLLTFEEEGGYIVIKPRQYLGAENFAKIASIIRGAGGEYISAGKESHFRVPKEKQ